MKQKLIEIYFAWKPEIDFGLIGKEWRKGSLKVPDHEWSEYLKLRFEFELVHERLFKRLSLKNRKAFNDLPYDLCRKER